MSLWLRSGVRAGGPVRTNPAEGLVHPEEGVVPLGVSAARVLLSADLCPTPGAAVPGVRRSAQLTVARVGA